MAEYAHTTVGAVIPGSFIMTSIGAYFLLWEPSVDVARRLVSVAIDFGLVATIAAAIPAGDIQAKLVRKHQPVTFAAMEGHVHKNEKL